MAERAEVEFEGAEGGDAATDVGTQPDEQDALGKGVGGVVEVMNGWKGVVDDARDIITMIITQSACST